MPVRTEDGGSRKEEKVDQRGGRVQEKLTPPLRKVTEKEGEWNERFGGSRGGPRTIRNTHKILHIIRAASKEPGSNTALAGAVCTDEGGGIETRVCAGLFGPRRVPAREREAPVGLDCCFLS